jgi:hypothetical protein
MRHLRIKIIVLHVWWTNQGMMAWGAGGRDALRIRALRGGGLSGHHLADSFDYDIGLIELDVLRAMVGDYQFRVRG